MPPIETQNLKQKAVLWAAAAYDDYGKYQVSAAVEIDCRWEDEKRQGTGAQDTVITTLGTVFVDQVIAVGSLMWKGRLRDVAAVPVNLKEVVSYDEIPDLKGRQTQKTVTVAKYNNQLPTIVV